MFDEEVLHRDPFRTEVRCLSLCRHDLSYNIPVAVEGNIAERLGVGDVFLYASDDAFIPVDDMDIWKWKVNSGVHFPQVMQKLDTC